MSNLEKLARALFGPPVEEAANVRAEQIRKLVDQRVDLWLARLATALGDDDDDTAANTADDDNTRA